MLQMAYVSDIAYITYFVSQVCKVTEKYIECDSRAGMSQMGVSIYGWSANVHPYMRSV